MSAIDTFIEYARKKAVKDPSGGWNTLLFGFKANHVKTKLLPYKEIAKGYQRLEEMMMGFMAQSLSDKESYIWGNIFAPAEIAHAFGLKQISVEALASFLSGYHLEDFLTDYAVSAGIAPTLCTYHRAFVGSIESEMVPIPGYAVTTSLTCDGNTNTFRYISQTKNVPYTILDIPYTHDESAVSYVAGQLRDMVKDMETQLQLSFDEEKLKQQLIRINQTRHELLKFYTNLQTYYYPGHIIHQMYMMMAFHLMMGSEELLNLVKFMNEEIVTCPKFTGKRLVWVNVIPFYQETLKEYFNASDRYQLMVSDIILDSMGELDVNHPFEAVADEILRNIFNGSYENKASFLGELAEDLKIDGVIHFSHWGCKQSCGGNALLKEEMRKRGVPMLTLDGDAIDERNSHDGQIKTRLEAFFEMLEA